MYRKDLSAANDISLCHIYRKVYMANLLEITRRTPPPKILVLTRCQRYLSTPYVRKDVSAANDISLCHIYRKVYMANLLEISRRTPPPKILVLTRCQRYLSVPYLKEILIWPIYWRYLAGYLQLKY